MRHLVSLVIAIVASVAGSLLLWTGGGRALYEMTRWGAERGLSGFIVLAVLGALLLGVAGFSIRFSPAGVIVVGAVTALLPLLLVIFPYDPIRGLTSPVMQLLASLNDVDPGLSIGVVNYVAFGPASLIGFAFLGAGILARRRRPTTVWRVLSAVGGVLALGFAAWAFAAGGEFYRGAFVVLQFSVLAGVGLTAAALLFGVALAPSGRSSIGAWIAGGVLTLGGVVTLLMPVALYTALPREALFTLSTLGWSGLLLAVGVALSGLALGVALRPAADEPVVAPPAYTPAPAVAQQAPAEPASGPSV